MSEPPIRAVAKARKFVALCAENLKRLGDVAPFYEAICGLTKETNMEDPSYTPEAIASMVSKLIAAGHEEAADMLRSLAARAQAAENASRDLRQSVSEGAKTTSGQAVTDTDPPVGESLDEISQGRHVGP